jgi:hypothetical protein
MKLYCNKDIADYMPHVNGQLLKWSLKIRNGLMNDGGGVAQLGW